MVPRLVPEISSLDAFCDGGAAAGGAGIGDSRSLIEIFSLWILHWNLSVSKVDTLMCWVLLRNGKLILQVQPSPEMMILDKSEG